MQELKDSCNNLLRNYMYVLRFHLLKIPSFLSNYWSIFTESYHILHLSKKDGCTCTWFFDYLGTCKRLLFDGKPHC